MAFVVASPELVEAAASDLTRVGSAIDEAHATALASTTAAVPAAGDEVSASIASVSATHAQEFEALQARAQEFHAQLV